MSDFDVSGVGNGYWIKSHREASIKHCANGYIVGCMVRRQQKKHPQQEDYPLTQERFVFSTSEEMLDFLKKYFEEKE